MRHTWWLALGLVLYASTVHAQAAPAEDAENAPNSDEEARSRFQSGSLAFDAGRYEAALNDFRQAYELSHRPALLFNIGAAAQNLRRDREALEAFEQYLRDLPEASNRSAVEARIEILRQAVADDDDGDEHDTAPAQAAGGGPSALALGLVIGGGVVAATGIALLAVFGADWAAVTGAAPGSSWADVQEAYDRSEALSISGGVGLGVGIVALGVGLVLWFVMPDRPPAEHARLRSPLAWSFDL